MCLNWDQFEELVLNLPKPLQLNSPREGGIGDVGMVGLRYGALDYLKKEIFFVFGKKPNFPQFHFIFNHKSIIPYLQLDGVVGSQEQDGVLCHLVLQLGIRCSPKSLLWIEIWKCSFLIAPLAKRADHRLAVQAEGNAENGIQDFFTVWMIERVSRNLWTVF